MKSTDIIYAYHDDDEVQYEIRGQDGRVEDGSAVGYIKDGEQILFDDIQISEYDNQYWDNYELEFDDERIIIG